MEKKAKTCILAILNPDDTAATDVMTSVYDKLLRRTPPHTFNVYKVDTSGPLADVLNKHLELGGKYPQILAMNWRGWYKRYSGSTESASDVLAWLDAVKLGEGKKEKIPVAYQEENEEDLKVQQEKIIEAAKKMVKEMGGDPEAQEKASEEEVKAKEAEKKEDAKTKEGEKSTHDEL